VAALKPDDEVAVIDTKHGSFKIRFFPEVAPKHVEHFKKLVKDGFYTGLAFHRVVPGRLIQGGDPTSRRNDRTMWGKGEPGQENVPAEFSSLPFGRGTLGAARKGNDINSASSQFFVCLERNPGWDGQYTVFGEVIDGLDVVEKISNLPSDPSQLVLDKVVMNRVHLEKAGSAAAKK
jgi:peptidyl-prolyl cis-trans isomerase B (cyclophilin B)